MAGAVIIVVVLVVLLPLAVMMGTSLIAAALGWSLKDDVDQRYEGTEYAKLGE